MHPIQGLDRFTLGTWRSCVSSARLAAPRPGTLAAMANPLTMIAGKYAGKTIPWVRMYTAGRFILAKGHAGYTGLDKSERSTLAELLRKSKGKPANLTKSERQDLGGLIRKAASAARHG